MSNSNNQTANLNVILRGYLRTVLESDRANRIDRISDPSLYVSGRVAGSTTADGDLAAIRAARAWLLASLASGVSDEDMAMVPTSSCGGTASPKISAAR